MHLARKVAGRGSASRAWAAAIPVILLLTSGAAAKPMPRPSDLIETYETLDSLCGEVGAPVSSASACEQRDRAYARIKAEGWCKAKQREGAARLQCRACGPRDT